MQVVFWQSRHGRQGRVWATVRWRLGGGALASELGPALQNRLLRQQKAQTSAAAADSGGEQLQPSKLPKYHACSRRPVHHHQVLRHGRLSDGRTSVNGTDTLCVRCGAYSVHAIVLRSPQLAVTNCSEDVKRHAVLYLPHIIEMDIKEPALTTNIACTLREAVTSVLISRRPGASCNDKMAQRPRLAASLQPLAVLALVLGGTTRAASSADVVLLSNTGGNVALAAGSRPSCALCLIVGCLPVGPAARGLQRSFVESRYSSSVISTLLHAMSRHEQRRGLS